MRLCSSQAGSYCYLLACDNQWLMFLGFYPQCSMRSQSSLPENREESFKHSQLVSAPWSYSYLRSLFAFLLCGGVPMCLLMKHFFTCYYWCTSSLYRLMKPKMPSSACVASITCCNHERTLFSGRPWTEMWRLRVLQWSTSCTTNLRSSSPLLRIAV